MDDPNYILLLRDLRDAERDLHGCTRDLLRVPAGGETARALYPEWCRAESKVHTCYGRLAGFVLAYVYPPTQQEAAVP